MATYRVTVSACAGGEHITTVVLRDNVEVKRIVFNREQLLDGAGISPVEGLLWLMRTAIKSSGATTPAQMKTAVEAARWEF